MNLHTWLKAESGRVTWLAERLGVTKGAVSQWRDNGVPMEHWPRIVELTDGQVDLTTMAEHAMHARHSRVVAKAA